MMRRRADGHVWIGWFSNWQYANTEPTVLWRGAQSIPRTLMLRRYADGLRLVQRPVRNWKDCGARSSAS